MLSVGMCRRRGVEAPRLCSLAARQTTNLYPMSSLKGSSVCVWVCVRVSLYVCVCVCVYKGPPLSCLSRCKKIFWVNFPSLYMAKLMGGLIRTQYIYIYVYVYTYVCYIHRNRHVWVKTHTHTCVWRHTYIHTYVQPNRHVWVKTQIHTYICICPYKQTNRHLRGRPRGRTRVCNDTHTYVYHTYIRIYVYTNKQIGTCVGDPEGGPGFFFQSKTILLAPVSKRRVCADDVDLV